MFVYLFLRERDRQTDKQSTNMGEADRGRHSIGSSTRLRVVRAEPNVGLEPTSHEIMI